MDCPTGTYGSEAGSTVCTNCSAGTSSSAVGASNTSTCVPCAFNRWSDSGFASCVCPQGYRDPGTGEECIQCEAGTYAHIGSAYCFPCPAHMHNPVPVASSCSYSMGDSPTCGTYRQNDDFIMLLQNKPPVGINIFSHYGATTGLVPDARGIDYEVTVSGGTRTIVSFTAGMWGADCLLYTSPSPRDLSTSRMPSSA